MEGKEKEADHFRLVDGRFNKQGSLHMNLVLGNRKVNREVACRNLKSLHRGLNGFSHIHSPDDLHKTLLSQDCIFEVAPSMRRVGRTYTSRTE